MDYSLSFNGAALLEARPDGVADWVTPDGAIIRTQDVTAILDANKAARDGDRLKGFRFAPDYRRVASIPVAAVDIAYANGLDILNDTDDLKRFLNDPANRVFRTTTERV